jgi:hypothetical protein
MPTRGTAAAARGFEKLTTGRTYVAFGTRFAKLKKRQGKKEKERPGDMSARAMLESTLLTTGSSR